MTDYIKLMSDTIDFSKVIIGKTEVVTVNTGIYQHSFTYKGDHEYSMDKDIYTINGSIENPISFNMVKELITYMKYQFKALKKGGYNCDRYEYITFQFHTDFEWYEMYWKS